MGSVWLAVCVSPALMSERTVGRGPGTVLTRIRNHNVPNNGAEKNL